MNHRKVQILLGGLLLAFEVGAANHRLRLNEELRLSAPIASHSLNRLVVLGDRIQQIFGENDAFSLQSDEQSGQIFIKPTLGNGSKTLVLTLVTENGLIQDLDLVPNAQEPSTIILKPTSPQAPEAVAHAKSPMQDWIETLRQAVLGTLAFQEGAKALPRSHPFFELRHQKTAITKDLKVEVWQLKNKTKHVQEGFEEEAFYQKGDLALSLEKKRLAPSEQTTLYILGKHHV
jgi:type-F conjugative transfer system secretin TraK